MKAHLLIFKYYPVIYLRLKKLFSFRFPSTKLYMEIALHSPQSVYST